MTKKIKEFKRLICNTRPISLTKETKHELFCAEHAEVVRKRDAERLAKKS